VGGINKSFKTQFWHCGVGNKEMVCTRDIYNLGKQVVAILVDTPFFFSFFHATA
jgi:hypothetical protein